MENTVKQRLIVFIEYKKISINKFLKAVNLSGSYIRSMKNSIQPDKLSRIIAKFPDLNPGWLMTGEGEMLRESSSSREDSEPLEATNHAQILADKDKIIALLEDKITYLEEKITHLEDKLLHLEKIIENQDIDVGTTTSACAV